MAFLKCSEHTKTNSCFKIIAEGKCQKNACKLYPKVLKMLPKFKRLYELEAQGVEVTSIWDFSEKGLKQREKRRVKAQRWLDEVLPRIELNIRA